MTKYKRLLIYLLVFGLAILLFYKAFVTQVPELWQAIKSGNEADIEQFLLDTDRWTGSIFLALLQFIQVISIMIPGAPIQIAGGMVYGAIRGYLLCHISYIFANFVVIVGVRKFSGLKELLDNTSKTKITKAVNFINKGNPFVTILLLCMIPLIPNGIIPYAASSMDIRIKDFTKAVAIGSFFPILIMCVCGNFILSGDYLISGLLVIGDGILVLLLWFFRDKVTIVFTKILNRKNTSIKNAKPNNSDNSNS